MAEDVRAHGLADTGASGGGSHRALDDRLVNMVAPDLAGRPVAVMAAGREDPLPQPFPRCRRVLHAECVRERDVPSPLPQIALVLLAYGLEM
jgi:hypothetical protein